MTEKLAFGTTVWLTEEFDLVSVDEDLENPPEVGGRALVVGVNTAPEYDLDSAYQSIPHPAEDDENDDDYDYDCVVLDVTDMVKEFEENA